MTARVHLRTAGALESLAASSVELVVTSPPYPMIPMWDESFARSGATTFDQMHEQLAHTWRALPRVLCPGGIAAINIGDALRRVDGSFQLFENHAQVLVDCRKAGLTPLPYVLWKKPTNRANAFLGSGFNPPNAYVTLDCEYVLLFRNGRLRTSRPQEGVREASRFTKPERDLWFSQVWDGIRGTRQARSDIARRTGAFPLEVPARLVRMFSLVGETVLDPFCGTGTTLEAAGRLGRHGIGFEAEESLAPILSKRLEHVAQCCSPHPYHWEVDPVRGGLSGNG